MDIASGAAGSTFSGSMLRRSTPADQLHQQNWYAVFTVPQNEKSVGRYLQARQIEYYLPTYEVLRVWKNRQHVKVVLPLFPSYLFVRIALIERVRVLQCAGVLYLVGNRGGPVPLPDAEIEFLRSDFCRARVEPYHELVVGQRVRVRSGLMQGVEGVLVRRNNTLRFVLSLGLINQQAAVEVNAEDLEPVFA